MASPVSPPVLERNGDDAEVIIIGGGLAGLSAAIYLARSLRSTLVIDSGKSMAAWEPDVQNYLGFPAGISGEELIHRGRKQAERYHVRFAEDEVIGAEKEDGTFVVRAKNRSYHGRRLLIATGIFHLPPDIEGVRECLGHSMYFCKDCDGYRNQGKALGIYGWNNLTVDYALGMLVYSPVVAIVSNGHSPEWDD
ncbi:MAG TPA: NAD(P)/FAD-dependent oxidoreductase, partial [Verrucomicrobiae bacterium]